MSDRIHGNLTITYRKLLYSKCIFYLQGFCTLSTPFVEQNQREYMYDLCNCGSSPPAKSTPKKFGCQVHLFGPFVLVYTEMYVYVQSHLILFSCRRIIITKNPRGYYHE